MTSVEMRAAVAAMDREKASANILSRQANAHLAEMLEWELSEVPDLRETIDAAIRHGAQLAVATSLSEQMANLAVAWERYKGEYL